MWSFHVLALGAFRRLVALRIPSVIAEFTTRRIDMFRKHSKEMAVATRGAWQARSSKLSGVCGHDLEAGARQRLDNALCNSQGFVGIHPFVRMVSTGFAYRGGNYRIYPARIGHGSLNLAGA
jgi:hypothetical protein